MSLQDLDSGALLSADGHYRFLLWRTWSEETPALGFCMLNPSTADSERDDPTIRRCRGFARRAGAGGIVVVNLSPYRAISPRDLFKAQTSGSDVLWRDRNEPQLNALCGRVKRIVLAWGSTRGRPSWLAEAARRAIAILRERNVLLCLGRTKYGDPRHPLMVPNAVPIEPYP